MRDIRAAVVRETGGPFVIENLMLDDPRDDEVVVRIVATGVCHSDIVVAHQIFPLPLPWVLGHEGAGIVEQVGAKVGHVQPGDSVVLSFDSCGHCSYCEEGHTAYCSDFWTLNAGGSRPDGSSTFSPKVNGCFFYQSSFATYALAHKRNIVKVRSDAPLHLLGPLGCGVQTGAGAVLNVLRPQAGTGFALFGAGAVGLSAMMAAKILGCDPIIVVDRVDSRLAIAKELGATVTINANREDAVEMIKARGGIHLSFEATGVPEVVISAVKVLRPYGTCAVVGAYPPGKLVPFDFNDLAEGRSMRQIVEGDSDPQIFIPQLVEYFMAGDLPIDKIANFYRFEEINQAIADSLSGLSIKPILWMGEGAVPTN